LCCSRENSVVAGKIVVIVSKNMSVTIFIVFSVINSLQTFGKGNKEATLVLEYTFSKGV
jgi:hypothetical protein